MTAKRVFTCYQILNLGKVIYFEEELVTTFE